jgi:hypothetical protein
MMTNPASGRTVLTIEGAVRYLGEIRDAPGSEMNLPFEVAADRNGTPIIVGMMVPLKEYESLLSLQRDIEHLSFLIKKYGKFGTED